VSIELVEQPDRWIAGVATRTRNADEMKPERVRLPGWRQVWTAEEKGDLRRAYRTDFELWPVSGSPEIFVSVVPSPRVSAWRSAGRSRNRRRSEGR
jgi:hypothetical protein